MKVKVTQLCPTLCDPMDCMVHGILQARILEWVAVPSSRGIFPTQGLNPGLLHCRWILYHLSHKGNPLKSILLRVSYTLRSVLNTRRKFSHLMPLAVLRQVRSLAAVR